MPAVMLGLIFVSRNSNSIVKIPVGAHSAAYNVCRADRIMKEMDPGSVTLSDLPFRVEGFSPARPCRATDRLSRADCPSSAHAGRSTVQDIYCALNLQRCSWI